MRDERVERTGPEVRLYRTRERQDFHTDGADIIGLLCLHAARSGGESRLASSYAVYNEILRRRPDLLEVLYEPMWWDRNGEESPGDDPAFPMPVLNDVDGQPRVFYIGWYIRDAQRHPQVPRLTGPQLEALDLIETIANDPAFHVEMDFRPGDVQLLNNAGHPPLPRGLRGPRRPRPAAAPPAPVAPSATTSPASRASCGLASRATATRRPETGRCKSGPA